MADLTSFANDLAASDMSLQVALNLWIVPTMQSIHIVAICAVVASMAMLDLRLLGVIGRGQPVRSNARRFLKWMWIALPVLLLTGSVLIVGEPARELLSPWFWYKMTMLAIALVLTVPLYRLIEEKPLAQHSSSSRGMLQIIGLVSLAMWLGIVFCGRWIAYG